MPVVVTLAYLYWMRQDINWVNGIWALLNIVVFHAAGNTWSDYFDYKHKVDAKDTFGAKTLTDGMFAPREIYSLSMALLAVALVAGIGLLWRTGLPLLYIGCLLYTSAAPHPPEAEHHQPSERGKPCTETSSIGERESPCKVCPRIHPYG